MTTSTLATQEYDLSGLRCPHLLITVLRLMRQHPQGTVLQLLADDPRAPTSISAWAMQSDYELIEFYEQGEGVMFVLRS